MKKQIILIIVSTLLGCMVGLANETPKATKAKSILLSGKISDIKSNEYLVGVKITCEKYNKTVYSDLEGNFLIYIEANTDENPTLEFSQVGYESKTLDFKALSSNSNNLYIDLVSQ